MHNILSSTTSSPRGCDHYVVIERRYHGLKNFKFLFILLAESNHLKKFNVTVSPDQLAEDFRTLKQHLKTFPAVEHLLVGPDVTQPQRNTLKYLQRYVSFTVNLHHARPRIFEI